MSNALVQQQYFDRSVYCISLRQPIIFLFNYIIRKSFCNFCISVLLILAPVFLINTVFAKDSKLSSNNSQVTGTAPDRIVGSPEIKVGYKYTFETENISDSKFNYVATREISKIEGNRMTVVITNEKTGSQRTLYYDTTWSYTGSGDNDKDSVIFTPALKYLDFPLSVGKQWISQSVENNKKTGRQRQHTIKGTVAGWERINIPAGEFEALKIVLSTEVRDGENISTGTDISWYAQRYSVLLNQSLLERTVLQIEKKRKLSV